MKTAEDIIISKRYFELNAAEKEAVKEYASNEEDYEAMRWFLISTGNEFAKEKIEPSSDLRRGVMAHLNQKQTAPKTIWLNGVSAFLFPSDKKFFQYPAFQMAAVAAVVVAIVLIYNQNPISDNQEMALNNQTEQQENLNEITAPETVSPDENSNQNRNDLTDEANDQMPVEASKLSALEKEATATDDLQTAPALYYRDMAVAEEVKLLEDDVDEYSLSSNISTGTNVQQPAQTSVDNIAVYDKSDADGQNLKQDVNKKQNGEGKDLEKPNKNADLGGGTTRTGREELDNKVVTAPAGYTTTVATNESVDEDKSKNEGEYKTATAGGVFGDVTTESEIAEEKEESAVKYSIAQTKMLKKLIFVVK
jgi:hypothetical protein